MLLKLYTYNIYSALIIDQIDVLINTTHSNTLFFLILRAHNANSKNNQKGLVR